MTNEAAERLRDATFLLGHKLTSDVFDALLDEALAAERRATVERIRAEVIQQVGPLDWLSLSHAHAILDAEAER